MKTRLCVACKIGWDHYKLGRDCPKCKNDGFFTINTGDIGTMIILTDMKLNHSDFEEYKPAEFNHPYEG